jgi:cobalt transporter subunit CbtB
MTTRILVGNLAISQRMVAGLLCLLIGGAAIFGVGLAQADTLHNAAHDTRHAIGFPCH